MKTVLLHKISDLSNSESKNEILLDTNASTELHIYAMDDKTIITLPFGNRAEIVDGRIVIHELDSLPYEYLQVLESLKEMVKVFKPVIAWSAHVDAVSRAMAIIKRYDNSAK